MSWSGEEGTSAEYLFEEPLKKKANGLKIEIDAVIKTDIVMLTCTNTECFNNRYFYGERTCNLKSVAIGQNGQCNYFVKREYVGKNDK